jgi:predicted Rossmann fold nucleotide-binding protein DprA/Smf involved in DNA uptake
VAETTLFQDSEVADESPEEATSEPTFNTLSEQQQTILNQIDGNPVGVETLVERTGLAPQIVLQELTLLSLKGSIRRIDGQTYARRRT